MATRNPMNQRYQGEGPGGQTRKSAASAKPTSQAAGSVYVKKKPVTDSEKRAAKKAREKEAAAKAKVKADKAAARAKAAQAEAEAAAAAEAEKAREADAAAGDADGGAAGAGAKGAKGAKGAGVDGVLAKLKKIFIGDPKRPTVDASYKTEEYKKWRKVYWILLAIGIVAVAISFYMTSRDSYGTTQFIILMVVAYGAIIAAFVVDFRKIRPLMKKRQTGGTTGKKTPKVLKHEQEAAAQAAAVEAARRAAKESKKVQRRGKTAVPGQPDDKE